MGFFAALCILKPSFYASKANGEISSVKWEYSNSQLSFPNVNLMPCPVEPLFVLTSSNSILYVNEHKYIGQWSISCSNPFYKYPGMFRTFALRNTVVHSPWWATIRPVLITSTGQGILFLYIHISCLHVIFSWIQQAVFYSMARFKIILSTFHATLKALDGCWN